jgi:geranylgeranyl diphosphate synthase, type II
VSTKERFDLYRSLIDARLFALTAGRGPDTLYAPVNHIQHGSGKRIRPLLVMISADAVGNAGIDSVDAAVAVETVHNFTLVHDDIMDRAETRRGRETIHKRWDEPTAILAGDVMVGLAYEALVNSSLPNCLRIVGALTRGIIDVCEGQSLDCAFSRRSDIGIDDYMQMITMKTARLLEIAAEIGALAGNGTPTQVDALRHFARNLGLAFQIQDDLLDLVADEKELGKRIGGDVVEGKRTFLLVTAISEIRNGSDRQLIDRLLSGPGLPEHDIPAVRDLFERTGVIERAGLEVRRYHDRAMLALESLEPGNGRDDLRTLAAELVERRS